MNSPLADDAHLLPRIDMSLAKGLRSAVLKRISATRKAADRAASVIFQRKATMPTTQKGVRKLHRELATHMDRFALFSNDCSQMADEAFWGRWAMRSHVSVEEWEEDQICVDGVIFNLSNPHQIYREFDYPIGLSMHLLERTFSRLRTTCNDTVLTELRDPVLIACGLSHFLLIEAREKGIQSMPVMIPSGRGAIAGDVILSQDGGSVQFRTFLGGTSALSPPKAALLADLSKWATSYRSHMGLGCMLGIHGHEALLANRDRPLLLEYQKHVTSYLSILHAHRHCLPSRDLRSRRAREEDRQWTR